MPRRDEGTPLAIKASRPVQGWAVFSSGVACRIAITAPLAVQGWDGFSSDVARRVAIKAPRVAIRALDSRLRYPRRD